MFVKNFESMFIYDVLVHKSITNVIKIFYKCTFLGSNLPAVLKLWTAGLCRRTQCFVDC